MAAAEGAADRNRRQGRRWLFASAMFDESSWTLEVAGRRVPIEARPLELLRELLLRAGEAVSKDDLLDAVWPCVSVVEASLPMAMMKLRRALGDEKGDGRIIETVSRIGYRLAVPVRLETGPFLQASDPLPESVAAAPAPGPAVSRRLPRLMLAGALLVALVAVTFIVFRSLTTTAVAAAPTPVTRLEVYGALRSLDLNRVRALLARGWDPNAPLSQDRNGAIGIALEICEWNPNHDRQKLMMLVRELMDGGARLTDRNIWGDTPYSIASARRYCGPDHPVTRMIYDTCLGGRSPAISTDCLAAYPPPRNRISLR